MTGRETPEDLLKSLEADLEDIKDQMTEISGIIAEVTTSRIRIGSGKGSQSGRGESADSKGEDEGRAEASGAPGTATASGAVGAARERADGPHHASGAAREMRFSMDGRFRLQNTVEGLFIAVHPPVGDGEPVTVEKVTEGLDAESFREFEGPVIEAAVEEASGEPVRIGPPSRDPRRDGRAEVRVKDGGLKAVLVILPPSPGGLPPIKDDIISTVADSGLESPSWEAVNRAAEEIKYGEETLIAVGKVPREGRDGRIEFKVDVSRRRKPRETEDGRVDFRSIGSITVVGEGEALAEIIPPTEGEAGLDVFGRVMGARSGRPVSIKAGKNTVLDEEKMAIISTSAGKVSFERGTISVEKVLEISGDLDMRTGNLDFPGTIVISGRINDGFEVRAEGDILAGGIGRSKVRAGGEINVRSGIVGALSARSGRRMTAKFIENSNVRAGGDILVNDAILHSNTESEGAISVGPGKGSIVGGRTTARGSISCKTAGSISSTSTIIEIGVSPSSRRRLEEVERELAEVGSEFERIMLALKRQASSKVSSPDVVRRFRNIGTELRKRSGDLTDEARNLAEIVEKGTNAHLNVEETCHPGVRISIGPSSIIVDKPIQFSRWICLNGIIRPRTADRRVSE